MPRRAALPWIGVLALATAVALTDTGTDGGDVAFFLHAGQTLLSADWARTYADPAVQAGPLELVFFGLAAWTSWAALTVLAQVGGTALLVVATLRALGPRPVPRRWIVLGVGWTVVVLGLPLAALTGGHPAHLLVPSLWLLAGSEARRGRMLAAGALVGLAGGLETWGLLGVAVLALAPGRRAALAGLGAAAGVAAVLFAPFVLFGDFAMGDYAWRVSSATPVGLLLDPGSSFPWGLRLLQAATAVAAGALVARRLRGTGHAVTAALATVAVVRLAFDPVFFSWYWVSLLALVIALAADLVTSPWFVGALRARSSRTRGLPMGSP
jgi:hypothetical protein